MLVVPVAIGYSLELYLNPCLTPFPALFRGRGLVLFYCWPPTATTTRSRRGVRPLTGAGLGLHSLSDGLLPRLLALAKPLVVTALFRLLSDAGHKVGYQLVVLHPPECEGDTVGELRLQLSVGEVVRNRADELSVPFDAPRILQFVTDDTVESGQRLGVVGEQVVDCV